MKTYITLFENDENTCNDYVEADNLKEARKFAQQQKRAIGWRGRTSVRLATKDELARIYCYCNL